MIITPYSVKRAKEFFSANRCNVRVTEFDFAIAVYDPSNDCIRGVIGMIADGKECALAHLFTDGTELVGSVLYGAAWRAAKALGYGRVKL